MYCRRRCLPVGVKVKDGTVGKDRERKLLNYQNYLSKY